MTGIKIVPHFGGNLLVSHFVGSFHDHDKSFGHGIGELFLQVSLGLAWSENEYAFCITNTLDDLSIVMVKLGAVLPLGHIIRLRQLSFVRGVGSFAVSAPWLAVHI